MHAAWNLCVQGSVRRTPPAAGLLPAAEWALMSTKSAAAPAPQGSRKAVCAPRQCAVWQACPQLCVALHRTHALMTTPWLPSGARTLASGAAAPYAGYDESPLREGDEMIMLIGFWKGVEYFFCKLSSCLDFYSFLRGNENQSTGRERIKIDRKRMDLGFGRRRRLLVWRWAGESSVRVGTRQSRPYTPCFLSERGKGEGAPRPRTKAWGRWEIWENNDVVSRFWALVKPNMNMEFITCSSDAPSPLKSSSRSPLQLLKTWRVAVLFYFA